MNYKINMHHGLTKTDGPGNQLQSYSLTCNNKIITRVSPKVDNKQDYRHFKNFMQIAQKSDSYTFLLGGGQFYFSPIRISMWTLEITKTRAKQSSSQVAIKIRSILTGKKRRDATDERRGTKGGWVYRSWIALLSRIRNSSLRGDPSAKANRFREESERRKGSRRERIKWARNQRVQS